MICLRESLFDFSLMTFALYELLDPSSKFTFDLHCEEAL